MEFIKYLIAQEVDYKWGLVTTTVGMQEGANGMSYTATLPTRLSVVSSWL